MSDEAVGTIRQASEQIAKWRSKRDEAIGECVAAGMSQRAVARAAGISHVQVARVIRERSEAERRA